VDEFICYKQKCKVVSLNLAHPVESNISKTWILRLCSAGTEWTKPMGNQMATWAMTSGSSERSYSWPQCA